MIRKAKSEAKLSMRAVVTNAQFTGTRNMIDQINLVWSDLCSAGSIEQLTTHTSEEVTGLTSEITLAEQQPNN
jgi:hypothetical protein